MRIALRDVASEVIHESRRKDCAISEIPWPPEKIEKGKGE